MLLKLWTLWWMCIVVVTGENILERLSRELDRVTIEALENLNIPPLDPENFMHHFIPDTGVGNRKEILIGTIISYRVDEIPGFKKWRYIRFNNTDYILAIQERDFYLWKESFFTLSSFKFLNENCFLHKKISGHIIDALMYVREIKHHRALHLAVIWCNSTCYLRVWQLNENANGKEETKPIKNNPMKLCYVKSYDDSEHFSLMVLFNGIPRKYTDKTIEKNTDLAGGTLTTIEVTIADAIDLEVFTVDGLNYIAIANSSQILLYRLNSYLTNAESLYPLKGEEIKDIETFRLGFKRFLAVAGSNKQTIYEWKNSGFVATQNFLESGAKQWFSFSVPSCREEVILILLGYTQSMFVWHGEREKFIRYPKAERKFPKFSSVPGTIVKFDHLSVPYILFFENSSSSLISINSTLIESGNPVFIRLLNISDQMENLKVLLYSQEESLEYINAIINSAVTTETKVISAENVFLTRVISENVSVHKFISQNVKVKSSEISIIEDFRRQLKELEASVTHLESLVNGMYKLSIENIVLIDEDAEVTGTKKLAGSLNIPKITTSTLALERVDNIFVSKLQESLYRKSIPSDIFDEVIFTQPLTAENLVVESFNNFNLDNVMLTNAPQIIKGRTTFVSNFNIHGNLELYGLMNDLNVKNDLIVLDRDRIVDIAATFANSVIVKNNLWAATIDGLILEDLNRTSLKITGDQKVKGKLSFAETLEVGSLDVENINGRVVNLSDIVRIDRDSVITGKKTFERVIFEQNLLVQNNVNGIKIPEDLVLKNRNNVIVAEKTFSRIIANEVDLQGKINPYFPSELTAITEEQRIDGYKIFTKGITVNHIKVTGLIDGVNITEVFRELEEYQLYFEAHSLNITELLPLEGISFDEFYLDLVFVDDDVVRITGQTNFSESVFMREIVLNSKINGYNITKDFLLTKGDQIISGEKIFKGVTIFEGNLNGNIDGNLDLNYLKEKSISLSAVGDLPDGITFQNIRALNELNVKSTINSIIFPQDLVLRNKEQNVYGKKTFLNPIKMDDVSILNYLSIKLLNGRDVQELFKKRITLDSQQNITGVYHIDRATFKQMKVFGSVNNNVNFENFLANVMSLSKHQEILGEKIFTGNSYFEGNVTTRHGVNGIDLKAIDATAIKLDDTIVFKNIARFEELLVKGNLSCPIVNEVDMKFLFEDSVTPSNGTIYIKGEIIFEKDFTVKENLHVNSINGIDFSKFLTKSTEQNITGVYTFEKIILNGNMSLSNLISGINLTELNSSVAISEEHILVHGNVQFEENTLICDNLNVTGTVNGLNVTTDPKRNLTVVDHVYVEENVYTDYINGIALCEIASDIVTIHGEHRIFSRKTFGQVSVTNNVHVDGNVHVVGFINKIDIEPWAKEVVYTNSAVEFGVTGTKIFEGEFRLNNLFVKTINGISSEQFLLVKSDCDKQIVTGKKTFNDLHINTNIQLLGFLNGYNLTEILKIFSVIGNETVISSVHLKGTAIFQNINATFVEGLDIQNLISNREQTIEEVTFLEDVRVKNINVTGLVNEMNFDEVRNVFDSKIHEITKQNVLHTLIVNDIEVVELVSSIGNSYLTMNKTLVANIAKKRQQIESYRINQTSIIRRFQHVLSSSFYIFDGFVECQLLDVAAIKVVADGETGAIHFYHSPKAINVSSFAFYDNGSTEVCPLVTVGGRKVCSFKQINIDKGKAEELLIESKMSWNKFKSLERKKSELINEVEMEASHIARIENFVGIAVWDGKCIIYWEKDRHEFKNCSDVTGVELFFVESNLFVVIGRSCIFSTCSYERSAIYKDGEKVQTLPGRKVENLLYFSRTLYHYLVFSDGKLRNETLEQSSVMVYRSIGKDGRPFVLYQKIPFENTKNIKLFEFGNQRDLYLVIANSTFINIYRFEGESGFTKKYPIWLNDTEDLDILLIDRHVFLIVAGRNKSFIFKAITRGSQWRRD